MRSEKMKDKEECALCQFCTHDILIGDYVCHNEDSSYFGKKLSYQVIKKMTCGNFSPHNYKMDLDEAYRILTTQTRGIFIHERLPQEDRKNCFLGVDFGTNKDLEDWRDALKKMLRDWIRGYWTDAFEVEE